LSRIPANGAVFCLLLAAPGIYAQESLVCDAPLIGSLSEHAYAAAFGNPDDETVQFEAGNIEAQMIPVPSASMSGGVLVRRGDRLAAAESAEYNPATQTLSLRGNVSYLDTSTEIVGQSAEFAYDTGRIRFEDAEFLLGDNNSRGAASILQISQDGMLDLNEVKYSTCPPNSDDWVIEAGQINIDTGRGVGTARSVKLRFKGVPILYAPYFSFPISNTRKSGILTPAIGSTSRSGNEVIMPYYWNIRDNYDATISPRWLSDRGLQLGTEFRYLTKRSGGSALVEYLNNDSLTGRSRYLTAFDHRTLFANGWRNLIDFSQVSDSQYFEDLGGTLTLASTTHLNRKAQIDFFGDHWALFAQVQDFQTLDESILPVDQPYRRLPQVRLAARYPDQFLGLSLGFKGEVVNFDRATGVTGWRIDAAPSIELPIQQPGWFIKPAVVLEYTSYDLKNTLPGQPNKPNRTLPIASFDSGIILERAFNQSRNLIQTIEPRLLYVHVPFRDQSALPVFDTISPDLNFVQLYQKNRFLGVDRIGDTDQVSLGITSRILDVNTGDELISATIGQTRSFNDQLVTLPGQPAPLQTSSDYIAELRFLMFENVNFDFEHQWGSKERGTARSQARFQYRPQPNKILNLAYRFRRDSLEQGDVSVSWPIAKSWNFVGRYNYSFRDRQSLEQFFGLEYESCCWGLRMVSRRYLSTRNGTRDTTFGLQLVLKGMMSVGTAADKMLERGILGYSPDND
jgi:LPS-assembly protein